jgi:hypothetical protein
MEKTMSRRGSYRQLELPITPVYRKWGARDLHLIFSRKADCCCVA